MKSLFVYAFAWLWALQPLLLVPSEVDAFVPHTPFQSTTTRSSVKESLLLAVSTDVEQTGVVGTTNNPRTEGLALMLDDGTRKSHSLAENTAFVSGFFKGLSTQQAYRNLLTSLYYVYQAMENAFDDDGVDVRVKALDDPKLRRLAALEQDMEYFYGSDWQQRITPSAATAAYVSRIHTLAKDSEKSFLLVSHQYSRYLGDLFGGQMMGSMARRSLDLTDTNGTAFYEFDEIPNTADFITQWYQSLNKLDLTASQKEEIVKEANYVFALNIALFDELEGSPFQAMWTLAMSSIKMKLGLS
eukprot:scaffold10025_cov180-Amphora_coffeaeformis.AAC.9